MKVICRILRCIVGAAALLAALTLNRRIAWNDCYVSVQIQMAFYGGKPIRHLA